MAGYYDQVASNRFYGGGPEPLSAEWWAQQNLNSAAPTGAAANNPYGLTGPGGREQELRTDPTDALVRQLLTARANGTSGPYDQTTRDALFTGATEQSTGAENQALNALNRRGLNASDPAYQAALQEITAGRQSALQGARLNINENANVANYNAQGQALGQLGAFQSNTNQGITDAQRYFQELMNRQTHTESYADPYASGVGDGMPTWQQIQAMMAGGGSGASAPAASGGSEYPWYMGSHTAGGTGQPTNNGPAAPSSPGYYQGDGTPIVQNAQPAYMGPQTSGSGGYQTYSGSAPSPYSAASEKSVPQPGAQPIQSPYGVKPAAKPTYKIY